MDYLLLQKFLISMGIGALIGVEREKEKQERENVGGFRTFILISLLGAFTSYLTTETGQYWYFGIVFFALTVLAGLSYVYMAKGGQHGIITELSIYLTFILGFIAMTDFTILAVLMSAVILILIESERVVHGFIRSTSRKEWHDALRFVAVAFVVYPLLPKDPVDPWGLVNISQIWLLVVLISGLSFVGYFLIKTIGANLGVILNGFLGGLVSSTATTSTMSNQSKQYPSLYRELSLATTLASAMMFLRVVFLIYIVAPALLPQSILTLLPAFLVMVGTGLFLSWGVLVNVKKGKDVQDIDLTLTSPFSFIPALKLALIFAGVGILSKVADDHLGNIGIILTSFLTGFADVDPIVISAADLFKDGNIDQKLSVLAILIAAIVNTFSKAAIAFLNGEKKYRKRIAIIFGSSIVAGVATIVGYYFYG